MSHNPDYPLALHEPDIPYTIRRVRSSDVPLLQKGLWQDRETDAIEEFVRRALNFEQQKRGIGIVVIDEAISPDAIIAYGQITQWVKCAEISDLIVHADHRGQGIGTAMIQYLIQHAVSRRNNCVELGVALSNSGALALYRRLGFQDSYTLQLDLGHGTESVLYLSIDLNQ